MSNKAKLKKELLRGPLLKIERAKFHISEIERRLESFIATKPFQLKERQRRNPPTRLVYIESTPPVPDDFALIVGDAVHNLRAALDHICYGLVQSKAKRLDRISFPFTKDPEKFSESINTSQMNVASVAVVQELRALRPYPSGNKYLHAISSIEVCDKHRIIILVGCGIDLSLGQLGEIIGLDRVKEYGPMQTRIATVGDFEVNLSEGEVTDEYDRVCTHQPDFVFGFGQGETLENEPLIDCLSKMVAVTEDAVRRLARAEFLS